MSVDEKQWSRKLNFNDVIQYRAGVPAWSVEYGIVQPPEEGPYVGKVVDFVDWAVGVRADGWMGDAPLFYVRWSDILDLV